MDSTVAGHLKNAAVLEVELRPVGIVDENANGLNASLGIVGVQLLLQECGVLEKTLSRGSRHLAFLRYTSDVSFIVTSYYNSDASKAST